MLSRKNVITPAIDSIVLFMLRKYTEWEMLYYLNLLTVVWFFASLTVQFSGKTSFHRLFGKRRADIAAGIIILGYGVLMSVMSVARHDSYSTNMYDLGNMDQAIWNSSRGNFLEVTSIGAPCVNVPRTINHLEWIYQVFALVYKVIPDVRILLIAQVIFVCAGLLGAYFMAKNIIASRALQIVLLLCMALFPMLQFANLFDFHGDVLAFPFLIWAVYFYDIKKNRPLSGLLILGALTCKEYAALPLFFYGIVLIVHYKDRLWGTVVSLVSCGYFVSAYYFIMPSFNNGNQSAIISSVYNVKDGVGLFGLILAIINDSGPFFSQVFSMHSFESIFYILFPTFFLVFKRPVFLLPIFPVLIKDLFAGIDIGSHRMALSIPFLFISLIYSVKHIESESVYLGKRDTYKIRFRAALLITATLAAAFAYGPTPLGHRFYREIEKYIKSEADFVRDTFIEMIPDTAVVSVSGILAPHCTHRRYCYQFPHPFYEVCPAAKPVDMIIVDSSDEESRMEFHHGFLTETVPWIESMGFTLKKEKQGVFLFAKAACADSS